MSTSSSPHSLPVAPSHSPPRDRFRSESASKTTTATHSTPLIASSHASSQDGHSRASTSAPSATAQAALRIDHNTKRFGSVRTVRMAYGLPCGLSFVFIMIAIAICGLWASSLLSLNDFAVQQSTSATVSLAQMVDASISANIQARLHAWLQESWVLVKTTTTLRQRGVLSSTHLDNAYWSLLESTKMYDYMTGLAIADDEQNTYVGIQRFDNGTYGAEFMVNANVTCTVCPDPVIPPTEKWYYHINSTTGRPISPAYNKKLYNFRTRGWYRNTTLANATTWTDLYLYSSGAMSGLSLCDPQYIPPRPDGTANGAVALDVSLQPLVKFLKAAMNNAVGTAYLMDSKGRLLASSTGEAVLVNNLQISAQSSPDLFTQETARRIQPFVSDNSTTSKIIRDSDFWFSFSKVDAGGATGLVIVAGKPTATYMGPIQTMQKAFADSLLISIRNAALVTAACLIAVTALAIHIIHRMVIVPLKQMRQAILKASELEFKHITVNDTMVPSRFDELNALQYAFRTMCASFATGIMQTRQLVKVTATSEHGSAKHGGSGHHPQTSGTGETTV